MLKKLSFDVSGLKIEAYRGTLVKVYGNQPAHLC